MGKVPFERVKEVMLSFLFELDDTKVYIKSFVKDHMKNIKPWYKVTKNDVILSASYYLWISEFAKELGVKTVIATNTDENGKIVGKNCKKQEKVNRLTFLPSGIMVTETISLIIGFEYFLYPYLLDNFFFIRLFIITSICRLTKVN